MGLLWGMEWIWNFKNQESFGTDMIPHTLFHKIPKLSGLAVLQTHMFFFQVSPHFR
jgi:hypothetical protein